MYFCTVSRQFRSASFKSWSKVKSLKNSSFKSENTIRSTSTFNKVLQRCGRYVKRIKLNSDNNEYNEQSLFMLPIYCQKLRSLHAFSLPSSTALRILAFRCQNITSIELSLESHDKEADENFSQLFSLNKKLKHIDICHGAISGACLLHLPPNSIESIVLDKCLSSSRYLSEASTYFYIFSLILFLITNTK